MKPHALLLALGLLVAGCSSTPAETTDTSLPGLQELAARQAGDCNLAPDSTAAQYVIGYGSLMQKESRLRTAPAADTAYAAELRGYRRGWFAKGSDTGFSTTFLGAVPDTASQMNAVVFAVSAAELAALDRREAGYCRSAVKPENLQLLGKAGAVPDGQFWIYSNRTASIALPSKDKPLVQSYVDIFIGGCLELEEQYNLEGFARECILSTQGWPAHWVNDRLYPRRPFMHQPRAGQIDKLLEQHVPEQFRQVRIE